MKLGDVINDEYPDGAITLEALLDKFVKKPKEDGSDEHQMSAMDMIKYLGWNADIPQAKRAKVWLRKKGFRTVNDAWCWRVAFTGTPQAPQYVI
jgi:hypothetical protein